jgi:hypothetical protein
MVVGCALASGSTGTPVGLHQLIWPLRRFLRLHLPAHHESDQRLARWCQFLPGLQAKLLVYVPSVAKHWIWH